MRTAVLFCLALILIGCATTATELRTQPPIQSLESDKSPTDLAECVLFKTSEIPFGLTVKPSYIKSEFPKGTFQISAKDPERGLLGEITITPNGNNGSHIELRSAWNFWDKNDLWSVVKGCASPQNSPGK